MSAKLQLVMVEDSPTDAELVARCLAKAGLDVVIYRVQTEPEFIAALPASCPVGLELPMLARAERGTPLATLLAPAIAAARALLAGAAETAA